MTKRTVTLFICIALIAVLLILSGTVFVVKDITVADYYGEEVEDVQGIIDSSKLLGNNVFTVSEDTAIRNIESVNPGIKVVQIVRSFPSSIKIVVHKRIALIAVSLDEEKIALIDRECKVVEIMKSSDIEENITLVNGLKSVKAIVGNTLEASGSSVARISQIVQAFEQIGEQGYRDKNFCLVTESITISGDDVSIKMREGAELRFNASVDYFGKLLALVSYYDTHEEKRASGIYTVGVRGESGEYQILETDNP